MAADRSSRFIVLFTLPILCHFATQAVAVRIYWSDAGTTKIQRADPDLATPIEDLVTSTDGLVGPGGIALDVAAGKLYWADFGAAKIQRRNMDGSGPIEDLVTSLDGLVTPTGIALDTAGGKIYWIERGGDFPFEDYKIQRRNMDGSGLVETLVTQADGLFNPAAITVHATAGKIYWTRAELEGSKIRRRNLDGSGPVEDVVSGLALIPFELEIDPSALKIYWANVEEVQRRDLSGGSVEDIATSADGILFSTGLALDVGDSKVYWSDNQAKNIRRRNMDGSGSIDTLYDSSDGLMFVDFIELELLPALSSSVWVEFDHSGVEVGSSEFPYSTIANALPNVATAGTIRIKPGFTDETVTISQNVVLIADSGLVRIGSLSARSPNAKAKVGGFTSRAGHSGVR